MRARQDQTLPAPGRRVSSTPGRGVTARHNEFTRAERRHICELGRRRTCRAAIDCRRDAWRLEGAGPAPPNIDWDFAIYYRERFEPADLRAKGWQGTVADIGDRDGGVTGAWLHVEGRRVDVHYRDLTDVEHRCAEAGQGRFSKELLSSCVAGIPTYVVMAELATSQVLAGSLPHPSYQTP